MIYAVVVAAFVMGIGGPALTCAVQMDVPQPWSSERVAGVSISIQHAAITGLRMLPVGWRFTIDNDPSWQIRLEGHAVVGAAFMPASALSGLIAIEPQQPYTCYDLAKDNTATLAITFYKNDRLRIIRFPQSTLQVVE